MINNIRSLDGMEPPTTAHTRLISCRCTKRYFYFLLLFFLKQDEHKLKSNTRQFLDTGICKHSRNLQWQGIKPLPLRVWVRFPTAATSVSNRMTREY